MRKQKLIMFVKAPVPGQVKTRLVPPLSHESAAKLYADWSKNIYENILTLPQISIEIAYDAHLEFPTPKWLDKNQNPVSFFLQSGGNLGEKLTHAFSQAFQNGAKQVVAIGSDSPGLPRDYIQQAFEVLEQNELVLGPTDDGGYYLIGLTKNIPQLFKNISWSSFKVFPQTLQTARQLNLRYHILPQYFDIDTVEDLDRVGLRMVLPNK